MALHIVELSVRRSRVDSRSPGARPVARKEKTMQQKLLRSMADVETTKPVLHVFSVPSSPRGLRFRNALNRDFDEW
tara:strand:- start:585 stop:812 length:228 start_codon:yes stop_codon:yes gene_type:complete